MSHKILHLPNWALSAAGNPLEMWSDVHSPHPYLFVGGVHGDEPEGVELANQLLNWMRHQAPESLHPWIVIPCLNVDGFRDNKRVNANGVDLNRNFPSRDWSSLCKGPRYYPGPSAGSEPEVNALVRLIEDFRPRTIIHFHSWNPCIVYTGSLGKSEAQQLSPSEKYPVQEDIGYPTPGSLGQYGWLEQKIPVICIEEQEHRPLNEIWPQFRDRLSTFMRKP